MLFGWTECPCSGIASDRFTSAGICFSSATWDAPSEALLSFFMCLYGTQHHSFVDIGFAFAEDAMNADALTDLLTDSGIDNNGCVDAEQSGPSVSVELDWNQICCFEPMAVNVGDTVTFNFNNYHNVYIHPSGTCDTADAVLLGDSDAGSASYTFELAETVTFACQVGNHCDAGQIVTITAAASACALPGDINEDGAINVTDILRLLGAFGRALDGLDAQSRRADVDSDGSVDVSDLLAILGAFGSECEVSGRRRHLSADNAN